MLIDKLIGKTEDKYNPVAKVALLSVVLVVGIFAGIYLRFADFPYASIVADILFVIFIIIMIRVVFSILK